jgi:hypothetical protein
MKIAKEKSTNSPDPDNYYDNLSELAKGQLPIKLYAVLQVVYNWRIRRRLPRITKLAVKLGLI